MTEIGNRESVCAWGVPDARAPAKPFRSARNVERMRKKLFRVGKGASRSPAVLKVKPEAHVASLLPRGQQYSPFVMVVLPVRPPELRPHEVAAARFILVGAVALAAQQRSDLSFPGARRGYD